ncbi:MAG: prolipoprotein diacylglyceryl transferase [Desulforegulaceae bacterium]|nr:prolipoprotein diacylglyceryl transferase [Desulforegulaceae bacterium]
MDFFVWNTDPILIDFGLLKIRWYGLFFALAFISGYYLFEQMCRLEKKSDINLDNLLIYIVAGTVVGARLFHCFFYDPQYYLSNPLKIIAVWEGGLASHGGGLGALISLYIYSKKNKEPFFWLVDRLSIPTALAGAFIRTGNFFNSEIAGTKTLVPWAVVFIRNDNIPRHPVQLYEAFSYFVIFLVLLFIYKIRGKNIKSGSLFGIFLVTIFSARIFLEFFKSVQSSYNFDFFLSTGQILSIPFILAGFYLVFRKN